MVSAKIGIVAAVASKLWSAVAWSKIAWLSEAFGTVAVLAVFASVFAVLAATVYATAFAVLCVEDYALLVGERLADFLEVGLAHLLLVGFQAGDFVDGSVDGVHIGLVGIPENVQVRLLLLDLELDLEDFLLGIVAELLDLLALLLGEVEGAFGRLVTVALRRLGEGDGCGEHQHHCQCKSQNLLSHNSSDFKLTIY